MTLIYLVEAPIMEYDDERYDFWERLVSDDSR